VHEADQANKDIERILSFAGRAYELGARIIVTNPVPIHWNQPNDKSDEQLKVQAGALERLGAVRSATRSDARGRAGAHPGILRPAVGRKLGSRLRNGSKTVMPSRLSWSDHDIPPRSLQLSNVKSAQFV
jgi:hypothetical protein